MDWLAIMGIFGAGVLVGCILTSLLAIYILESRVK